MPEMHECLSQKSKLILKSKSNSLENHDNICQTQTDCLSKMEAEGSGGSLTDTEIPQNYRLETTNITTVQHNSGLDDSFLRTEAILKIKGWP